MNAPHEPIDTATAARILREIATYLELLGENPFKARAHENVARALEGAPEEVAALVASGRLRDLPGVGETIAGKLEELVRTGRLVYYEELRAQLPATILELTAIPGLGPKKIRALHTEIGVAGIDALEAAARDGRVAALKGFGARTAEKILEAIEHIRSARGRFLLEEARDEARRLIEALGAAVRLPDEYPGPRPGKGAPSLARLALAGSLRRFKETVKDLDLVGASDEPEAVMAAFVALPGVARVTNHGPTKSSVILASGIAADLRIVAPEEYPYALVHFTGSAEHNTQMRSRAKERGLKLNEYGLWRGEERLPAASEADVFAALGLAEIPPELREAMGEIDAAEKGPFPHLVTAKDYRGVLHCHSTWSDGRNTISEMAEAARAAGLEYLGICDHSKSAVYAGGLTPERVRAQWAEIDSWNAAHSGFRIFKGIESDILGDGALDYDDELLAGFDFVVASVHSRMTLPEAEMTARIVRAVRHPATTILGHPSGRRLGKRDAYAVDLHQVIAAAIDRGVVVEHNCNPERMDLDWRLLRTAIPAGLVTSINPDAHATGHYRFLETGAGSARKGAAEPRHVLNTKSAAELAAYFKSRKEKAKRS